MSHSCLKTRLPVYQPLIDQLREELRAENIDSDRSIATETDLGRQYNLSRISVRRAVDQLISEGLIERRPGKGLFKAQPATKQKIVEVILPGLHFHTCVKIAKGVQQAGHQYNVDIHVYDAHSNFNLTLNRVRSLPERVPDGAIIFNLHTSGFTELLYQLKMKKYPFVLLDGRLHGVEIPSVVSDNYGGGYSVGKALGQLGHKVVGCIGNLTAETVRARFDGLRDALIDMGILFNRTWIRGVDVADPLGNWDQEVDKHVRELLSMTPRPTALFLNNDGMAPYVYEVLAKLNLRIPEDISVVGFDGDQLGTFLTPKLSTVQQPSLDMGREALELLMQFKTSLDETNIQHRVLKTEWIQRESVRAVA